MFTATPSALFRTVSSGAGPRTFLGFGAWVFGWELWLEPMEALRRRLRVAGFDQRGSGETACAPGSITPDAMVDDVPAVMDALGIERCMPGSESRGMVLAARDDPPAVVADPVERFLPEPGVEHLKRWARHIGSPRADVDAAVAAQEAFLGADVRPRLGEFAVPTLRVHGTLDAAVPLGVARENAAAIPTSKLVVLEGTGHAPTAVRPREVANAVEEYFGGR